MRVGPAADPAERRVRASPPASRVRVWEKRRNQKDTFSLLSCVPSVAELDGPPLRVRNARVKVGFREAKSSKSNCLPVWPRARVSEFRAKVTRDVSGGRPAIFRW